MTRHAEQAGLTQPDRVGALETLNDDEMKKLAAFARIRSAGSTIDADDLLQGAYLRWLQSDVAIEGPQQTFNFLVGAINSQRSNAFRREKTVKSKLGERKSALDPAKEEALYESAAQRPSQDDSMFLQQLFDLLADDPDIQLLLMCLGQQATKTETMEELGWDAKKYEAVRKRKVRRIAKLTSDGVI
ncbi:MAG: hypothetical protein HKN14_04535 [Marinicaulis sp.]|nr:hypothetical protein [Marinicaulis sp.]